MIYNYHHTHIYYELHGKGPAIVLLHGFLESSSMWEKLLPKLSETNTVLTVDLPGHGKSGSIGEIHSMEMMADIVHEILKQENIPSATFMGHSMGGYVVLAYAEKFNENVEKIILLNSTSSEDSEERKKNRDRALKVIDKNPKAFISMAISNLFPEKSQEKYASDILKLKKEAFKFPVKGIKASILGMKVRKNRDFVLKNFSGEKMMMCGTEDPVVLYEEAKTLAFKTKTKLVTLSGGHMGMVENFSEIVQIFT